MEHRVIYFKHGIRDIIPYSKFIEKVRPVLKENGIGEYIGDDMAIDGGDAEGVFSCWSARALFEFIRDDLDNLSFMRGARVTFILGELDSGVAHEEFNI
jgi:hypothetical protein